jgi:hypothetical protein
MLDKKTRIRFPSSPIGAHSGPGFDKLLPLIEDGAALRLKVLNVRERIERLVGV